MRIVIDKERYLYTNCGFAIEIYLPIQELAMLVRSWEV